MRGTGHTWLPKLLPLCLIAVAVIALTVGGILLTIRGQYSIQAARLEAVADFKTWQIADWLQERLSGARFVQTSTFLAGFYWRWRDEADAGSREQLIQRLGRHAAQYADDVLLLNQDGEYLWSLSGASSPLTPALKAAARSASTDREIIRLGPYRNGDGSVCLDFIAALPSSSNRRSGVVVLRSAPENVLYPTLNEWPAPSASSESVLFRVEGEEILYLNDVRHQPNTALSLRLPIARANSLSTQALKATGPNSGLLEGLDYRGEMAVGVARRVPNSSWVLMAKMDRAEIISDAAGPLFGIALSGILALLLAGSGALVLRQRELLARTREEQALRKQQQSEERVAYIAHYDELTGLPNRTLLMELLRSAMAQAKQSGHWLAVCCIDLDDFKKINDHLGQRQGDQVLVEIARRLSSLIGAGDTLARIGGDEFVLLLPKLSSPDACEAVIQRILSSLQRPIDVGEETVSITASLGLTLYPDDASDADTLMRHGDQTLYAAKQAGGNRYRWFDTEQERRRQSNRDLLQRIQNGLAKGEFRLHYQPKVNMRSGVVIGAEALIRWQHPDGELLSPARFMPMVDQSDLAIRVSRWVIQEALTQRSAWDDQGLSIPVSVNLCSRHLLHPDFVPELEALRASLSIDPLLEFEVLETVMLDDIVATSELMRKGQQLSVQFSLDDFGTGYSSLTYLKHLPVSILKIDQSFVRDLLTDAEALAIVKGVIGLASAFQRVVIAEGVETVQQGVRLLELGCELAQGYGIAKPMPPEELPAFIANWQPPGEWSQDADTKGSSASMPDDCPPRLA